MTPGYFDAHLHLFWVGEQLLRYVDVSGCATVGEVLEALAYRAGEMAGTDGWVLGRGLDQEVLREGRFPTQGEIDRAVGGRPAVVSRVCGHVGVVSSAVGVASEDGVLREGAFWEAIARVPAMSDAELEECVRLALAVAEKAGLSGVCTMIEEARQVEVVLRTADRLPMRVTANIPGATVREFAGRGLRSGMAVGERLKIGAAKFFSDGTLGARTAFLSEDYSDAPGERGLELLSRGKMTELFAEADGLGFQVAVHAIGDAAVRNCLAALEPLTRKGNPLRHRVEHVSMCPGECMAFMAERGIWAVVQPQFAGSDSFLRARLGERVRQAYRFAEMCRAGVPMAFSSDAPVEKIDPAATIRDALRAGMSEREATDCYVRGSETASWWL